MFIFFLFIYFFRLENYLNFVIYFSKQENYFLYFFLMSIYFYKWENYYPYIYLQIPFLLYYYLLLLVIKEYIVDFEIIKRQVSNTMQIGIIIIINCRSIAFKIIILIKVYSKYFKGAKIIIRACKAINEEIIIPNYFINLFNNREIISQYTVSLIIIFNFLIIKNVSFS